MWFFKVCKLLPCSENFVYLMKCFFNEELNIKVTETFSRVYLEQVHAG